MAYTAHGHHIPGSAMDGSIQPEIVARCGGVKICDACALDAYFFMHKEFEFLVYTATEVHDDPILNLVYSSLWRAGITYDAARLALYELNRCGIVFHLKKSE